MTGSEQNKSNLKKSSPFLVQWVVSIVVAFVLGMAGNSILAWITKLLPPTIEERSKDSYDSFKDCPELQANGVDIQSISWNAKNNKCIYKYKVKVD